MKKVFLLLLFIPLFFLTCKKEKDAAKQLYLSKIYEDGLLTTEYIYSADKKPLRRNFYSTNLGQSVFASLRLYQYSTAGLLDEVVDFTKANTFIDKYKFQYDINKKPSRMDELASDNTVQYYSVYEYSPTGYLAKFTRYIASTNKKTFEGRFTNDADGKIKKLVRYFYSGNNATLNDSTTFTFNSKLPAHWNYFESLPDMVLPNSYRYFFDMTCDSLFYYHPDTPPFKSSVSFSGKEYNAQGYLSKQTITYVNESNSISTTHSDMSYEYVE